MAYSGLKQKWYDVTICDSLNYLTGFITFIFIGLLRIQDRPTSYIPYGYETQTRYVTLLLFAFIVRGSILTVIGCFFLVDGEISSAPSVGSENKAAAS